MAFSEPYWLDKPSLELSDEDAALFRALRDQVSATGELPSDVPKWVYLEWLSRTSDVVFHGSGAGDIELFEPRKPKDHSPDEFSKQTAVFASGDAIWALFYAILDRSRPGLRFLNAAFQEVDDEESADMRYFFSVTRDVLARQPWRDGTVYILPKDGFVQMPAYAWRGCEVLEPQWASPVAVAPLAKLRVKPEDFPFLADVRGHDNAIVMQKSRSDPYGFPWLDE